jgi:hypothetical protein
MDVNQKIDDTCCNARKKIEHKEPDVTHLVFHPAPEEVKEPHISDDVQPAPVQEHAGHEGKVIVKRKAMTKAPLGIRVSCGDKAKEIKGMFQSIVGEG